MKCLAVIVLFAIGGLNRAQVKLPDYIQPCRPKNTECLKNLLKNLRPRFIQGIPEFNLPPIEPLKFSTYNQSNPFLPELFYTAKFSNMDFVGLSNFSITEFKVNLNNLQLILKIRFPHVVMTAIEIISLNGFGTKLDGEGPLRATFSNVTLSFSLFAKENFQNGKKYLDWKEDIILASFDQGVYEVSPTYERTKDYQSFLDKASQTYSETFNPEMKRFLTNTLARFMLEILNFVHKTYSTDGLYLPEIQ